MKAFTIYTSTKDKNDIIVLREGFCIEAFIFGPLWALYKKMWLIGIATIALHGILYNLTGYIPSFMIDFIGNLVLLLYGFFAVDLMSYKLCKNSYNLEDIIIANSQEEAEINFLRKNSHQN
jgi:hypothetical protein